MKPLLAVFIVCGSLYLALRLGKYLGKKTEPKEPNNSKEDQSQNWFT